MIKLTVKNYSIFIVVSTLCSSVNEIKASGVQQAARKPVISSIRSTTAVQSTPFTYQILANNSPTRYGASGLPAGLSVNTSSGLITGIPTEAITKVASITATNSAGTGSANLTIKIQTAPYSGTERYGAWAISPSPVQSNIDKFKPAVRGLHITGDWEEIEPVRDRFDWESFDVQFATLIDDNNYFVGFDVLVGPNSPAWIYCAEDSKGNAIKTETCVPKVHVTGQTQTQSSFFPYYLDPYYKTRYYNILQKVAEHIATTFPQKWKDKILYWEATEGSTGDAIAYKGTVKDSKYAISVPDWDNFRHAAWLMLDSDLKNQGVLFPLALNTGNDGGDFEWALENLPCAWTKSGNSTHEYSFNGEINEVNRYAKVAHHPDGCNRVRAEFQDVYLTDSWKKAPAANTYAITLSALTIGLDLFNLTGASIDGATNTSDITLYDTFSKFAGVRLSENSDKAFVYLRDVPDFADTTRFPEADYGSLWDDARAYQNIVNNINDDKSMGESQKAEQITTAKENHLNASRISKIKNASQFIANPAVVNPPKYGSLKDNGLYGNSDGYNIYDYDFGIDMIPDNYGRHMKQLNPNGTSIGQWRIGSDKVTGSRYGRYARSFDYANGKKEMIFDIADDLDHSVQVKNLKVSVTYYDQGDYKWSLHYATTALGLDAKVVVKNTNTGKWVTKTWILPSVNFMNKYKSGDLSLTYQRGGNTIFGMIEIQTTTDAPTIP